jgi:hypothetical protein
MDYESELLRWMRLRVVSGNDVPVTSVLVSREKWDEILSEFEKVYWAGHRDGSWSAGIE